MNLLRVFLLGLVFGLPALALAQWQWVGNDGRKVFSDQPPPPDIPSKNIIKQPGLKGQPPIPAEVDAAAPEPAKAAASVPKLVAKDKRLDEKKKQAEAAEAEKKKAEEEKYAKAKAENCDRVKRAKASYDSGVRIVRTNAKGEREYMDDATRAAETKRLQGVIETDCK